MPATNRPNQDHFTFDMVAFGLTIGVNNPICHRGLNMLGHVSGIFDLP